MRVTSVSVVISLPAGQINCHEHIQHCARLDSQQYATKQRSAVTFDAQFDLGSRTLQTRPRPLVDVAGVMYLVYVFSLQPCNKPANLRAGPAVLCIQPLRYFQ